MSGCLCFHQEKVHPKALIDNLLRITRERQHDEGLLTPDLFADFNGIPKGADKTEFYAHDQNWSNRMILGDSLQVMASLAEREGLRGKVQCIYFDPPYGIKFNSNFQWSTTSRDVKDGKADHITREPEPVKAFRDTWRDGIHSSLTYLRDQLTVARDLLTESGSIFVQIGDENVHRVRAVMDEVFGDGNHVATISFQKTVEGFAFFGGRAYTGHRWSAAPARQRLRRSPEMGQDGNRADHRPPAPATGKSGRPFFAWHRGINLYYSRNSKIFPSDHFCALVTTPDPGTLLLNKRSFPTRRPHGLLPIPPYMLHAPAPRAAPEAVSHRKKSLPHRLGFSQLDLPRIRRRA